MSIPLADVFLLWHTYDLTDDCGTHEEVKLIGLFSSEEKASEAMEQLKDKENGYQNLRSEGYRRKSLTERVQLIKIKKGSEKKQGTDAR